jgi:hypothetical protein
MNLVGPLAARSPSLFAVAQRSMLTADGGKTARRKFGLRASALVVVE